MRIQIEMTGTSPLVMHNAQLSDPLNKWAKEIAALAKKKKKTEEDHLEIGKLEFLGGLYVGAGGIVMPTPNIKRCLIKAAVIRRQGKAVERALLPVAQEFLLIYDGPKQPEKLWADEQYRFRASVKVGQSRVQRTRPRFPRWQLASEWELMTDAGLNLDEFERICTEAGLIEGLGDHRSLGSGRFDAAVAAL